jgi:8-oxo-dGTP pyrophosphatase MutT (NUDIX family)
MTFAEKLLMCFQSDLPGTSAHMEMFPPTRADEMKSPANLESAVKSAVLIAFYLKNDNYHLVFMRRQEYDGIHSGQISFPGGRWEKQDKTLYQTALREANEEISLNPIYAKYIGKLTDLYIPPSNFIVSPFVVLYEKEKEFSPDLQEVAQIIEIPFDFFLSRNTLESAKILVSTGYKIAVPCYNFNGIIIWGATAMILHELITQWKSTV